MIRKMKGNVTVQIIFMHQPSGLDESGVMSRNCWYIWNIYFLRECMMALKSNITLLLIKANMFS